MSAKAALLSPEGFVQEGEVLLAGLAEYMHTGKRPEELAVATIRMTMDLYPVEERERLLATGVDDEAIQWRGSSGTFFG